ncbi:MAG: cysteine--tRNA ligase, partial [Lachnospiraceae bacterium]|nr:cysteine--tRNA ligase [Lachnospiraceae bacterium]
GKLSHKNMDDLDSAFGRDLKVSGGDGKEDAQDFVLWKPKKEGEPYWESPWCEGRPGWHIECSVMAKKYLGPTIDIHAGGEDLIFPHHENEIAQSEAANGVPFAHYWMHNGFLNIDNVKMSKSLGNFFTVRDISEKYDLEVLRFFMLSAHYRSPLNFSAELMESAAQGLKRIKTAVENLSFLIGNAEDKDLSPEETQGLKTAEDFVNKFNEVMDDDLNTADAISTVFELVRHANTTANENSSKKYLSGIKDTIVRLMDILGLEAESGSELLDEEIEKLIEERNDARKNKNFKRADEIRDQLKEAGIILEDTRAGVKWKRA